MKWIKSNRFYWTKNARGRLEFNNGKLDWNKKVRICDNVILYDDWNFNDSIKNHYKNKMLLPSDDKQNLKIELEDELSSTKELIKLNDIIKKLGAPPTKITDRYYFSRYSHRHFHLIRRRRIEEDSRLKRLPGMRPRIPVEKDNDSIARKIFKFYNANYNENFINKAMKSLDRIELNALSLYLQYINRKEEWGWTPIFRSQSIWRYTFLYGRFKNKEIPLQDIQKIKNALMWTNLFYTRKMREKIRILENYIEDDDNDEKLKK